MGPGGMVVIVLCVVLLLALFAMRGSAALKGDVPKPVAGLIVVAFVVVAGMILYKMTSPNRTAGEEEPPEAGMMGPEGGMTGPGMGLGMPMGGGRPPSPHRELGQFVRKMAAFNAQEEGGFTEKQTAALTPILKELQAAEAMTAAEAEAKRAELEAVLTADQISTLDAVELPRRRRGGESQGADTEDGRQDWRATMRANMLEIPYVKQLYDQKMAEDPEVATDEEKQNEFFRGLRNQLSPFLQGSPADALNQLLDDLSRGTPE